MRVLISLFDHSVKISIRYFLRLYVPIYKLRFSTRIQLLLLRTVFLGTRRLVYYVYKIRFNIILNYR